MPAASAVTPSPPSTHAPPRLWRYASPQHFHTLAGRLLPGLAALAAVLTSAGLVLGLAVAPTDHQQGEAYRIIYVHVPAAWIAMVAYLAMAFWAALGLALNTRLSFLMMRALAPTGASFAFLALWTGALWGQPTWGTWWVWDARLTSMLLLLFLYVGFLALTSAIDDARRGDRAGAVLALAGAVNVPVIYFSVQWWNTLHQGASISLRGTSIAPSMLWALLATSLGLWAYAAAAVLARARTLVIERDGQADWVARLAEVQRLRRAAP
jgi:heme exporter protein C